MAYTRRHFAKLLQAGAAMTAVALRPERLAAGFRGEGSGVTSSPAGAAGWMLNRQLFDPLTGSEFRVASTVLTLLAVESTTRRGGKQPLQRRRTPDVECTTLRFAGHGAGLPAGTYRLTHETAGEFELYVSPGRPGRYLAHLVHVPEGYLDTVSIPRGPAIPVIS